MITKRYSVGNTSWILSLGLACLVSGCVTESKPEDAKPFISAAAPAEVKPKVAGSEAVPNAIVVKCRVKNEFDANKFLSCGPSTVKITNEFSKSDQDFTFKGDRLVIPVSREASYSIEIKTKSCTAPRFFAGMTTGMVLTAQFENCGTNK